MLRFLISVLFLSVVYAKHEIYDGHSIFEVTVQNLDQTELVNKLEKLLDLDVWSQPIPQRSGQILVPKEKKEELQNLLKTNSIEYKIEIDNVKELLELEDNLLKTASRKRYTRNSTEGLSFDSIHTFDEVYAYLDDLAATYPDLVTVVTAGKSIEDRDIKYVKISTSNFEDQSKPIVYMETLLHAREWITLPVSLYAIQKLVTDVADQEFLQNFDWIILPIANPDGYVHSHEQARFWRKNRASGYSIVDPICKGVDLNRNFDVFFGEASSVFPCVETFHGAGPFSEPETRAIKGILEQYGDRIELFFDIHSYGSMILYGYGTGVLPPNGLMIHLGGVLMAQKIDELKAWFNRDYIVGNVASVLYQASGSAMDYAKIVGIPLSYCFELPSFRIGASVIGFLVEPEFIEQAGFETWEGIKVGARFALDNYRARKNL